MVQDNIYIYGSDGTVQAKISQAIDANLSERLNGELTLMFVTKAERIPEICADTEIAFRGQYYRAVQMQNSVSDGAFLVTVSCEQESIALVDDEIELFDQEGTPDDLLNYLLDGTGITASAEYTDVIRVRMENTNRRAVFTEICGICGAEIEYSGHTIRLVSRRGTNSGTIRNLSDLMPWTDFTETVDLRNGTVSYEVSGADPDNLILGETVQVTSRRFGITTQKRIVGISYNPFNCTAVQVEVGDYVPDILDSYRETLEESSDALEKAENASKIAEDTKNSLADYAKKNEVSASIDTYVNSESGRASIVQSLHGTYVESDVLDGYTKKTELSAEIGAYIDTQAGTAKIVNKLEGTFVKEEALGNFVEKTKLSAEIGSYIDTQAGTAKIISAASGTYQKKSDMSGYVTTTTLNTSIAQYIDSSTGKAKIVSACSGTYAKTSDLSGYAKVSAVTSIEQSVSDVEAAITLSSNYTKNTIGTNVNALLQLVSNPNSSNIKLKADMIEMTGTTKFLKASDIGSSGTTVIDGGRILSGKISAKYIDVDEISASTVYGKGAYSSYIAFTSSGKNLYIGGDALGRNSFSDIFIKSDYVGFGDDGNKLVIDLDSKIIRHNYTSGSHFSIGSNTKPFASLYVDEIYIGGKKLDVSTSSSADSSKLTDSIYSSYYLQLKNRVLTPSTGDFSLGTTTYPFDTLYIGSSTYHWTITKDSILPNNTSSLYFNIGSATYPVQKLYAKEIYLNGTKLTTTGGSSSGTTSADYSGKELKMGGSSSYYIVANTNRELRPTNSSIYSNYFYLGTASYPWHYAYIGSVATMIGTQSGSKLGFFGTNPVARQSVSNSATVATLITALKNYGLIA